MAKKINTPADSQKKYYHLFVPADADISNIKVVEKPVLGNKVDSTKELCVEENDVLTLHKVASIIQSVVRFAYPLLMPNVTKPTGKFLHHYLNVTHQSEVLELKVQDPSKPGNAYDYNYYIGPDAKEKAEMMEFIVKSILEFCKRFI